MVVESIGTSLVVGKLRGGKFTNMQQAEIKKWYLIVIAFIIEFLTVYLSAKGYHFISNNIFYIHLFSYLLLFAGMFFNREQLSFKIIFAGTLLNFLVIMLNGGQMPVSTDAMLGAGLTQDLNAIAQGQVVTHMIINANTVFKFLGDVFYIPSPYPRPKAFSVGDVFIAVGVFVYIQDIMIQKIKKIAKNS